MATIPEEPWPTRRTGLPARVHRNDPLVGTPAAPRPTGEGLLLMNYNESEGLAQALFEESGDALFLLDPETDQLLDANSTAQRLTGFALRELLRIPATQLFRFDDPEGRQRLTRAAGKTEVFHGQEGYSLRTTQDGVWVAVTLTVARLHVKPKTLGLLTVRDVRAQHAAHSQLIHKAEAYRRLLALASECLWSGDIDNAGRCTYRYLSPSVESITGRPPAFFLEAFGRWWSILHAEDRPRWQEAVESLRAGRSNEEEYRVVRPDGSLRWVRERVQVSPAADGRSLLLEGVITDLTDRKP
jgi:PAS domain S-box-containing protein